MPQRWSQDLEWLKIATKGISRAKVLKIVVAETCYEVWRCMNEKVFDGKNPKENLWRRVRFNVAVLCNKSPEKCFCYNFR